MEIPLHTTTCPRDTFILIMIFLINKSIELYSLAANTGNDAAQIILEDAYMNSDGVEKDAERRPQIKEMK